MASSLQTMGPIERVFFVLFSVGWIASYGWHITSVMSGEHPALNQPASCCTVQVVTPDSTN